MGKKDIAEQKRALASDLKIAILATAIKKTSATHSIPADQCLSEFGQKNLGQYLGYLKGQKIESGTNGEREDLFSQEEILDMMSGALTNEDLESPQFFSDFLLKFHEQRADSASYEDRTKKSFTPINYTSGYPHDFTRQETIGNTLIDFSETIGNKRTNQEDAIAIGEVNTQGWEDSNKVPQLLENKFAEVGKNIRALFRTDGNASGSTAIVNHYSTDQKLTIANLGDSRSVLFIRNPDGSVRFQRLTNDNEPDDILEEARITNKGGAVLYDMAGNARVNENLMIARSFGDIVVTSLEDDETRLISYKPDIYQYDIAEILGQPENAGCETFLLTSCDGLYDHKEGMNEETYATALETWFNDSSLQTKWNGSVSEYIRDCAISLGSTDNITVCFSDITKAPTKPMMISVFDGHGGDAASSIAAEVFGELMKDPVIEYAADKTQTRKLVEKLGSYRQEPCDTDTDLPATAIKIEPKAKENPLVQNLTSVLGKKELAEKFEKALGVDESERKGNAQIVLDALTKYEESANKGNGEKKLLDFKKQLFQELKNDLGKLPEMQALLCPKGKNIQDNDLLKNVAKALVKEFSIEPTKEAANDSKKTPGKTHTPSLPPIGLGKKGDSGLNSSDIPPKKPTILPKVLGSKTTNPAKPFKSPPTFKKAEKETVATVLPTIVPISVKVTPAPIVKKTLQDLVNEVRHEFEKGPASDDSDEKPASKLKENIQALVAKRDTIFQMDGAVGKKDFSALDAAKEKLKHLTISSEDTKMPSAQYRDQVLNKKTDNQESILEYSAASMLGKAIKASMVSDEKQEVVGATFVASGKGSSDGLQIGSGDRNTRKHFKKTSFVGENLGNNSFANCQFTECNFEEISDKKLKFANCTFDKDCKFPTSLEALKSNSFSGCKFSADLIDGLANAAEFKKALGIEGEKNAEGFYKNKVLQAGIPSAAPTPIAAFKLSASLQKSVSR